MLVIAVADHAGILYAAHAGKHKNAQVVLTDDLWRIDRLFQALLVLTVVDEDHFSRPFSAFAVRINPVNVALEVDASLFGGGGLIMTVVDGAEQLIGCFDVDLEPLKFGVEARYQNLRRIYSCYHCIEAGETSRIGCEESATAWRQQIDVELGWHAQVSWHASDSSGMRVYIPVDN